MVVQRTILICMMALLSSALAFVPSHNNVANTITTSSSTITTSLKATPIIPAELFTTTSSSSDIIVNTAATSSSSTLVSVSTLDPTTILSDVLGGLIGGPAILLVPIVAALGIAGLIAFFIVSYANPADEDD